MGEKSIEAENTATAQEEKHKESWRKGNIRAAARKVAVARKKEKEAREKTKASVVRPPR